MFKFMHTHFSSCTLSLTRTLILFQLTLHNTDNLMTDTLPTNTHMSRIYHILNFRYLKLHCTTCRMYWHNYFGSEMKGQPLIITLNCSHVNMVKHSAFITVYEKYSYMDIKNYTCSPLLFTTIKLLNTLTRYKHTR